MSLMKPAQQAPMPTLPPATLADPAQGPTSSKPKRKSMQPSFLGTDAVPAQSNPGTQGKTLLGQ